MPNKHQVGKAFGAITRALGARQLSTVSMPLVAALAVSASMLHGTEYPAAAAASVRSYQGPPVAAFDHSAYESNSYAILSPSAIHLLRGSPEALAPGVAGPTAWAPVSQVDERKLSAVRPPLALSIEQRNIASFVARKYRLAANDVQQFVAHAYQAAREFRIDPYLVLAVMSIESSFNPNARSSQGAQGLMQVLTRVHTDKFAAYGGARAAFDPMANIIVGSRILKEYLVREGSVEGALKSYVGAALLSHDFGYGRKVLSERDRIAAAAHGGPAPLEQPKPTAASGSTIATPAPVAPPGPAATGPGVTKADAAPAANRRTEDQGVVLPSLSLAEQAGLGAWPQASSVDLDGRDPITRLLGNLSE